MSEKINNNEDGGYYAIKGFDYQINKAIFEILNTLDPDEQIRIEYVQDVDSSNFVMQVKYKEQAKFVPSIIKEPIKQLIDEFTVNQNKLYSLYAFFGNLNGYDSEPDYCNKKISIETLNRILGNESGSFSDEVKTNFVLKFTLDFSPSFDENLNQTLLKLKECYPCITDDEAVFYYANIAYFLRSLVVTNKKIESSNRSCTRKQVVELLNKGRSKIFSSSLRKYKGDKAYFEFIKKEYFVCNSITTPDYERFIILELNGTENISEIKKIVLAIKDKYYKPQNRRTNSYAPYIYFRNISDENLKVLKTQLLSESHTIKDGYDFYNADFSVKTITKMSEEVCLKFLHEESSFKSVISQDLHKTKEIYQFFINNSLDIECDIKHIKIQINELADIAKIIS